MLWPTCPPQFAAFRTCPRSRLPKQQLRLRTANWTIPQTPAISRYNASRQCPNTASNASHAQQTLSRGREFRQQQCPCQVSVWCLRVPHHPIVPAMRSGTLTASSTLSTSRIAANAWHHLPCCNSSHLTPFHDAFHASPSPSLCPWHSPGVFGGGPPWPWCGFRRARLGGGVVVGQTFSIVS